MPSELEQLAKERETAIVLTAPWHERDTQALVERLGVPVYTPEPDSAEDLMAKYGITAEQAGDGSPDVRWLLDDDSLEKHLYSAGDRLPIGIEVFAGRQPNDVVLWVEAHRAVVAGDTREQTAEPLRPLLELPVEHVLPAHGEPTDRSALERALS